MSTVIGIIGGGQLGRMMAFAAKQLGCRVIVLEQTPDSPAAQVVDDVIVAKFDDSAALEELARRCDVITYEFENVPLAAITWLENRGARVAPGSRALEVTQDRLREKTFANERGIATAPFAPIDRIEDLAHALAVVGLPAILKTRRGGYDGKGQARVASLAQAEAVFPEFRGAPLIAEGIVPFEREVSVIATRTRAGELVAFPLAENEHVDGILARSFIPAQVDDQVHTQALRIADVVGRDLAIVGTFTVECFLAQGQLLLNEIAPRVHNSGHATIEAATISQFATHIRAMLDLPIPAPRMRAQICGMANILGTGSGNMLCGVEACLADADSMLHLYGKTEAVDRRKMGHITVIGDDLVSVRERLALAHSALSWQPGSHTLGVGHS